jgi:FixJ family two-component response regulator
MSIRQNSRLIAIVDDDESLQSALQDLIESNGLSTLCFGSAEQFLNSEARHKAACLIADIRMPGMSGLELQAKVKAEGCRIPIISSLRMATRDANSCHAGWRCGVLDQTFRRRSLTGDCSFRSREVRK